jgi:hypothetical protein
MLRALGSGVLLTTPVLNDTGAVTALLLTERGRGDDRMRLGLVATGAAGERLLAQRRHGAVSVVGALRQARIVDRDGRERTVLRLHVVELIALGAAPVEDVEDEV